MQISSVVIITLCALMRRVSAAPQELYTLITSKQYGLNLTHDAETGNIGFQRGSFNRHWIDMPVTQGFKNWHCFRSSKQTEVQQVMWWIRFDNYTSGQAAKTPTYNYGYYHPSLFEVERVGDTYYVVSLEPSDPKKKLAWSIENDSPTGEDFRLKLRPYSRSPSQEFAMIQEPGDPKDMFSSFPPVGLN
ncbi:hypothetical protein FQN49_006267 [Arthroderma sp. PD_2]|nr:hypothetical protein FQN49_006267 [Arthroderma sp. PD_2]